MQKQDGPESAARLWRTYAIAKGLARDSAHLVPHLSNLRRDLGRKNGADQAVKPDTTA